MGPPSGRMTTKWRQSKTPTGVKRKRILAVRFHVTYTSCFCEFMYRSQFWNFSSAICEADASRWVTEPECFCMRTTASRSSGLKLARMNRLPASRSIKPRAPQSAAGTPAQIETRR
jgi:hypothetical protein